MVILVCLGRKKKVSNQRQLIRVPAGLLRSAQSSGMEINCAINPQSPHSQFVHIRPHFRLAYLNQTAIHFKVPPGGLEPIKNVSKNRNKRPAPDLKQKKQKKGFPSPTSGLQSINQCASLQINRRGVQTQLRTTEVPGGAADGPDIRPIRLVTSNICKSVQFL